VIYDMMIRLSSLALLYFLCKYCVSIYLLSTSVHKMRNAERARLIIFA